MTEFFVILQQIINFLVMLIIGYIAARTGIASEGFLNGLAQLIMKIILPILVFTSGVSGTTRSQLFDSYPILLLALAMYAGLIIIMIIAGKVMGLKGDHNRLFRGTMIFGNSGFLGLPLVLSLFPETGGLYIAFISIVDQSLMWTYGLRLATPLENAGKKTFNFKNFINPALVAIALMIIVLLCGITISPWILTPLSTVGKSATPLSLIYLGGLFYHADWTGVLKKKEIYVGMFLKMIAFPIAFYYILTAIFGASDMINCVAILSALPTMTAITMFAKSNENEPEFALGTVLVSTAVSLVTLTIVSYVIF